MFVCFDETSKTVNKFSFRTSPNIQKLALNLAKYPSVLPKTRFNENCARFNEINGEETVTKLYYISPLYINTKWELQ